MKKTICAAVLAGLLLVQAAALPEMGALNAKSAALYAANGQELFKMCIRDRADDDRRDDRPVSA